LFKEINMPLNKSGKVIHKMSCHGNCSCGAAQEAQKIIDELLPRMSDYKRQYHAALSQLQEAKRKNANLNDRVTKAEAKVKRLETYIENLEDDIADIDVPPTIDDDEPESGAPWVLDEEDYNGGWVGSDFQNMWEESDLSEDDGW
jgi:polyhydroxyalkanoate synthesis regulator phasin